MRNARRLAAFGSTAAILVALTLVVLAATLVAPRTAEAHADIEVARPGAGEVLARSPQRIEITFTEAVALDQSHVHVLDTTGARVDLDDLRLVEGDLRTLRVGVPELPEGAYTVDWGNLSTVDGHTLTGSYVFFIGADAFTPPDASADDGGEPLPIAEPLTRWGVLLGLVLLAGVPAVFGLVLARTASPEDATTLRRDIERIALVGGAVVLVVGGAQLAFKLNEADAGLSLLTDTRWGNGWALRTALATLATAAYAFGPRNLPRRARPAVPVLAVAAALSVSLTSHGAASEDVALVAGLVDALHVLATVAWGGGLVAFLVLARRQRTDRRQSEVLRAAIPRLSQCSSSSSRVNRPSLMSVPRPAMFVAIITAPIWPAFSTMCASRSCCLALSTSCLMPYFRVSICPSISLFSTLVVPTRIGLPASWNDLISSTIASHLSFSRRNIRSSKSRRTTGLLVGIDTTSRW